MINMSLSKFNINNLVSVKIEGKIRVSNVYQRF